MRRRGGRPDWDQFPDVVLGDAVGGAMPAQLEQVIRAGRLSSDGAPLLLSENGKLYGALTFPINDPSGRTEGQLVALADLSQPAHVMRRAMIIGGAVAVVSGAGLLAAFWLLIGRVGAELGRSRVQLRVLATHDGLTGLYNHRMLYANLDEEVERAGRYGHSVSLLMLDIDWFKRINDEYGHVAGDAVLRQFADRVSHETRSVDTVYRYGGEEIAVLLPETVAALAEAVAERMRAAIADKPFALGNGAEATVTVSIGVAEFPAHVASADELVVASDEALYAAKKNGRNQVRTYTRVPG
jgi:diguanylate cyclase (GGDEF)-like protein